ncbi:MAG: hypothetical protein K2X81_06530, partial [Candidatus Obscuribacterales bacterium]|nr:hypothetical protein [Candidatus Obscuribacterales bacterium]
AKEQNAEASQRDGYAKSVEQFMNTLTKSLPARSGEQYSDVLARMFPKMKDHDLATLSHDVEDLNGHKTLERGHQFEILTEYGKNLLKERLMKGYDNNQEGTLTESKNRSRFSPAYEQVMKSFETKISKATAAEAHLTKSAFVTPSFDRHQTSRSVEARLRNNETDAKETLSSETTQPKDISPEKAVTAFSNSCHEFAKSAEQLQFLEKWYAPESAMYQWGFKKFEAAFEKSQRDFEQLKSIMQTEEARERLDAQWQAFILRQRENLRQLENSLPLIKQVLGSHNTFATEQTEQT